MLNEIQAAQLLRAAQQGRTRRLTDTEAAQLLQAACRGPRPRPVRRAAAAGRKLSDVPATVQV